MKSKSDYVELIDKILIPFFIILTLLDIILNLLGDLRVYWIFIAFIFVILHSLANIGIKSTTFFFALTVLLGFFSELLGVKYGWVFGSYYYISRPPWMIFGLVPIQTPLSWSVLIYIGYCTTNIIFKTLEKKISIFTNIIKKRMIFAILLACVDALIVMNIDMVMDPVASGHSWIWLEEGSYYGIPLSNFIGWFLVTFIATCTFRTYNFGTKSEKILSNKIKEYLPLLLYFTYFAKLTFGALFGHTIDATRQHYPELALIAIASMMPFILVATIMYVLDKFQQTDKGLQYAK
ncbi:MAG: carotenoid biosynthesis protein [Candidatus Methanoperedens sp.]|nr:carotenoid biosynthesis protein [Candidatus Methanoperedens sp.]MCZ7405177.1 carotenoid biosynthesis protein [Candidatus Methanoperedens sp.]